MRKYPALLAICFTLCSYCIGQSSNAIDNLQSQAQQMGTAFIKADYQKFVSYNHPNLLKAVGGEDKMIELLKANIDQITNNGFTFETVGFGEAGKMINTGTELQTTITQYLVMKTPKGRMKTTSTLVAFSADDGHTWKFADASGHDIETVRKLFPNLSSDIIVPRRQPPVHLDD